MGYLCIKPEEFNPQILYIFRSDNKNGYAGKNHYHDNIELNYVVSGTAFYTIDDTVYEVREGNLLILNPGIYHQQFIPSDVHTQGLHIGINKLFLKGLSQNLILPDGTSPLAVLTKYANEFSSCIHQIIVEQESKLAGHELVLKTLVMRLIVILIRELYSVEDKADSYKLSFEYSEKSIMVNTIIEYINNHYNEEISLDKLSKNHYLSPVYLSKVFKEETGDSPINYLINLRLDKAKELLEKGSLSIKAVAKLVGYNDAYYFSKLFKKHFGISPSKLKK
ncbi:AraC family transcriptional regulator [Clostridium swellfunianum]|uniref:helix-turn-helix domain-containing protein n=1 Tax=Clostridium swellfunianum TaxID=1367462 RepID=UPI00202F7943|nr:helix-turn-helix domain-containing protein [Clostridium swellfunianum]MCM0649549.1 AraC family transcriptional regulator [Clostridium swellfunianum]